MKNVYELTDEELEDCVDGSTNIEMLKDILKKPNVVGEEGFIDLEEFGQWFAYGLEGYIDAEEGTDEWDAAYENNQAWGEDIADNINEYIQENE